MSSQKISSKAEVAHIEGIWAVSWCGESKKLLTGSLDGTVKYWQSNLEKAIGTTPKQRVGVSSVVASINSDRSMAAACYQDSSIRFYNLLENSIEEVKVYDEKKQAEVPDVLQCKHLDAWSISLAPDGLTIAAGSQNGSVALYSLDVGHENIATFETNSKLILSSAFSPSVDRMVCSSIDGSVYLFDVFSNQLLSKFNNHALPARCVKFSPDGNLIYSASDDRQVCVYDTMSGVLVNTFSHLGMALSVDASPDHRHFVVGTSDNCVTLWDLGMQRRQTSYSCHTDQVWGVAFDPKDTAGRRFVSVGDDALVQLYE